MKSRITRICALLLVFDMVVSLFSINSIKIPDFGVDMAYADGVYVGTGNTAASSSGSGTFSALRSGYRFSIIDRDGNIKARKVDIVFSDPLINSEGTAICTGSKIEPYGAYKTRADALADGNIIIVEKGQLPASGGLPPPMVYESGTWKGKGNALKSYLLETATSISDGITLSGSGGGSNLTNYSNDASSYIDFIGRFENVSVPNPEVTGNTLSVNGYQQITTYDDSFGDDSDTSTTSNILSGNATLTQSLTALNAMSSTDEEFEASKNTVIQYLNEQLDTAWNSIDNTHYPTIEQKKVIFGVTCAMVASELGNYVDSEGLLIGIMQDAIADKYREITSADDYSDYTSMLGVTTNSDDETEHHEEGSSYGRGMELNVIFDLGDTSIIDGNTKDYMAYATHVNVDTYAPKVNLINLLEAYPTGLSEDQRLFRFLNQNDILNVTFSIENQADSIEGYTSAESHSVLMSMLVHQYILLIEPIFWFRPEKYANGRRYGAYAHRFYGTPTNYGKFIVNGGSNGWKDKEGVPAAQGNGGNYVNAHNKAGAKCLRIPQGQELNLTSRTISGVGGDNTVVQDGPLSISENGYALHYYTGMIQLNGTPKTHTWDNPRSDPHPAPDPNNIPPTPFESEDPGRKTWTRSVHIVKCYDTLNTESGTYTHDTTTHREANPGEIDIENEPQYKVVDYFSSIGLWAGGAISPQALWTSQAVSPATSQRCMFDDLYKSVVNDSSVLPDNPGYPHNRPTGTPDATYGFPIPFNESASTDTPVATVKIGWAADPDYTPSPGVEPAPGYRDTTLYVRLVRKSSIPETSTSIPPDDRTPHAPPTPYDNDPPDPQTTPPVDPYTNYRIVKVYETEHTDKDPSDPDRITVDYDYTRYPTNPIVTIEDEGNQWRLKAWHVSQIYPYPEHSEVPGGTKYQTLRDDCSSNIMFEGTSPRSRLDVRVPGDPTCSTVVTVYVLYRRSVETPPTGSATANLMIHESQINKAIATNDTHIGDPGSSFANYSFAMTVGSFTQQHTAYCSPGCESYTTYYGTTYYYCPGFPCDLGMYNSGSDRHVTFKFSEIGAQDQLEVTIGSHDKLRPTVYGNDGSGSSGSPLSFAYDYPEGATSMSASGNEHRFISEGKNPRGAEYVTTLWRMPGKNGELDSGEAVIGYKDIPTLAKFKESDLSHLYGAESWAIVKGMIEKAGGSTSKTSALRRADTAVKMKLNFTFGVNTSTSDLSATAACESAHYSHSYTDTQTYYPIDGTQFTYPFEADVAIRWYKGEEKSLSDTSPSSTITPGNPKHEIYLFERKSNTVKFFPYIRMTYMLPVLASAEGEEGNTLTSYRDNDAEGNEIRHNTYVLSEYESESAFYDAFDICWSHPASEENSLQLTSKQWSLHKRAVNNGKSWNGTNQVLPGGAIYQLTTPTDNMLLVHVKSYQTVVSDRATGSNSFSTEGGYLSSDPGVGYKADDRFKDHLDFVNDAKDVLDNLRIVQWVSTNVASGTSPAWPSDTRTLVGTDGTPSIRARSFDKKLSGFPSGVVCIDIDDPDTTVSLSTLGPQFKATTSKDEKYHLRDMEPASGHITYQSETDILKKTTDMVTNAGAEKANQGDLDIVNTNTTIVVFKCFSNAEGDIFVVSDTTSAPTIDSLNAKLTEMDAINGDTTSASPVLTRTQDVSELESHLDTEAKDVEIHTKFFTNVVNSLVRNKGNDKTASWEHGTGHWFNEAFDGIYLVRMYTVIQAGFSAPSIRVAAIDPSLCGQNVGQSDLYSSAVASQFCLNNRSDAAITSSPTMSEADSYYYIGTFRDIKIKLPDFEDMYKSKKFYIPNATVQDLN